MTKVENIPDEVLESAGNGSWRGTPTMLNNNGTLYVVGWNEHGWFDIVHVEHHIWEDQNGEPNHELENLGEYPITALTPRDANIVADLINEGGWS